MSISSGAIQEIDLPALNISEKGAVLLEVSVNTSGDAFADNNNLRLEYSLANSNCDSTNATRAYWKLRTANNHRPMHGIVGARCSGASASLARISEGDGVPQVSPASNAAELSDDIRFPFFSRLVAPNNEFGEVGAFVAMLRAFRWTKVTTLGTGGFLKAI